MTAEPNLCINHPETEARRRCYQCLSSICPSCQQRAMGHIFCSLKCRTLYWISERAARIRRFSLRVSLRYRKLERTMVRITGGGLVRLLTIVLLLVLLYQSFFLVNTVREIPLPGDGGSEVPAFPSADLEYDGQWITVTGRAPGFGVAVLLADGKERDVCTVLEGRFSFIFEPDDRTRSVQVQVYGDRLPTLYTRAMPIPENTAGTADTAPETGGGPEDAAAESAAVRPVRATPRPAGKAATRFTAPVLAGINLTRGQPERGTVAITFDGGSYSNAAARILDVLAERNLTATFFLTGEFMSRYPEITRRIGDEGHEVGNHTYSHLHLTTFERNLRHDTLPGVTQDLLLRELRRNEEFFHELTGKKMVKMWRAPYGEQNETIRRWAGEAGYRHISWTYDPKTRKSLDGLDWVSDRDSALYLSSDQIVDKIISFDTETEMGLAGGIVLLHLGSERKTDPFHPKLGQLIDRIQEMGYRIEPVGQMLGEKG